MKTNFMISVAMIMAVFISGEEYPEQKLLSSLMKDYNHRARPVNSTEEPINVTLTFYLTKVASLDTNTQIFTVSGWLQMVWYDTRLSWNPSLYGNMQMVTFDPTDVWRPTFALENSAGNFFELAHTRNFKVTVDSEGRVEWEPGGLYRTYCPVDVLYYPFDTQTCDVRFGEWTYSSTQLQMQLGVLEVLKDEAYYQKSGEWRITETAPRTELIKYGGNETFYVAIFSITLQRLYLYYFVTILFPSLILSSLVLLVYAVPRELEDRLSMGVTLMLAYFVFMLNIADNIPRSTEVIPYLQIYLLFYMTITAVTIGLSVMVLWLNYTNHVSPPPSWLRFLVYEIMATAVCYRRCCGSLKFKDREESGEAINEDNDDTGSKKQATDLATSNLVQLQEIASATDALEEGLITPEMTDPSRVDTTSEGLSDSIIQIKSKLLAIENGTKNMMKHIWEIGQGKDRTPQNTEQIKDEWRELTKIINVFAFCVLFLFTLLFIIMCIGLWAKRG